METEREEGAGLEDGYLLHSRLSNSADADADADVDSDTPVQLVDCAADLNSHSSVVDTSDSVVVVVVEVVEVVDL